MLGQGYNSQKNVAKMGGGLYLKANAKLYILKYMSNTLNLHGVNTIEFTSNSAHYGGAVYIDDDTNSGTCDSSSETQCFFQALAVTVRKIKLDNPRTQNMNFSQNQAKISGSTLYGGLYWTGVL